MKELDIVHPAAKTLVDIAKSQDAEVNDQDFYYTRVFVNFFFQRVFSIFCPRLSAVKFCEVLFMFFSLLHLQETLLQFVCMY